MIKVTQRSTSQPEHTSYHGLEYGPRLGELWALVRIQPLLDVWSFLYCPVELLKVLRTLFLKNFLALEQVPIEEMKYAKIYPTNLFTDEYQLAILRVVLFQSRFEETEPAWKALGFVVFNERLCLFFCES